VARTDDPPQASAPRADAQITNERGVALMTLHADCMPIILCDPALPAVGAIHAGWRGTTLDVAGATVRRMVEVFGADPSRMIAYLGPSIRSCCYEVGDDVLAAWREASPNAIDVAISAFGERWRFDLDAANRWLLRRAGLAESRIESSGVCTRCGGNEWFSHRGQGPDTGRYGAIVAIV
jgi:YfiH family protein